MSFGSPLSLRQCSRRSGGAQGHSERPTVSGHPLGPLRGEDEGPGLHVGSRQGDPPGPGLERRRLVQGNIVCPSAPTPETKGANEPRASESPNLKPGKPREAATTRCPALSGARGLVLAPDCEPRGVDTSEKDPSLWSWKPKRRQQPVPGCATRCWLLGISAHVLEGLEWVPEVGIRGAEITEATVCRVCLDLAHSCSRFD